MNLQSPPIALGANAFSATEDARHMPGVRGVDRFGRQYRYVKAGAVTLVAGNVLQSPAVITNHLTRTPVAAAIGATSLTVDLGATAAALDLYKDGFATVDTTPGEGYSYAIEGHDAVASDDSITVRLSKDTPVQVALTTSSRVSFHQNPYKGVIQAPVTTLTGTPVGVAVYPITANYFGWIGTRGLFCVLVGGTPIVGSAIVTPGTSAGMAVVDGAAAATIVIGRMAQAGSAGLLAMAMVNFE
jgi:hypothetical protein